MKIAIVSTLGGLLGLPEHTAIWDGAEDIMKAVAPTVGSPVPLWDAYLAYAPGVSQGSGLPKPKTWAHQLWALEKTHAGQKLQPKAFTAAALAPERQ